MIWLTVKPKSRFKRNWEAILAFTVALLISGGLVAAHYLVPQPQTGFAGARAAVVAVVCEGTRAGAGAIISPDGFVLTCAHLGAGNYKVYVLKNLLPKSPLGEICLPYDAEVVLRWDTGDLQLLKITSPCPGKYWPWLRIASRPPKVGDSAYAWGHPLETRWRMSNGVVNEYRWFACGLRLIGHTCSTNAGGSGGPLVDSNGKIIGVDGYMSAAIELLGGGYIPLLEGGYAIGLDEVRPTIFALMKTWRKFNVTRKGFKFVEDWIQNWLQHEGQAN